MSKNLQPYYLCQIDDLINMDSKEFQVKKDDNAIDIFLVRHHENYFAYLNQCPHTGVSLNWMPDQFLDYANHYIQCSTHGALFRKQDGYCIRGPCAGDSLIAVTVLLKDDKVFVEI